MKRPARRGATRLLRCSTWQRRFLRERGVLQSFVPISFLFELFSLREVWISWWCCGGAGGAACAGQRGAFHHCDPVHSIPHRSPRLRRSQTSRRRNRPGHWHGNLGAAAWININSKISHWKGIFPAKMARLHGTSCHCFMARPCVGRHTSAVRLLVGLGGLFLHGHVKAGRVPNPGS